MSGLFHPFPQGRQAVAAEVVQRRRTASGGHQERLAGAGDLGSVAHGPVDVGGDEFQTLGVAFGGQGGGSQREGEGGDESMFRDGAR